MRTLRTAALVATTLVTGLLLSGCSTPTTASAPTSPSGSSSAAPAVLRMAFVSRLADREVEVFQDELTRRGSGGLTLTYEDEAFPSSSHGVEQTIVRAVAEGRLDLGWVGARAFGELGVQDFDPLVAPLVLDSVAAERAVLTSDLPDRMLGGLERLGVTGLAVLAGPMRRPIAAGRPLTTLSSFDGVPFFSWHGELNAASVTALGAENVDVAPPVRNERIADGSIRAYENTVAFLADNADWPANVMTANVNLWPSVSVLVANPRTLAALAPGAREALEAAVATTAARALDLASDEGAVVRKACTAGARFALAGGSDLAAIEAAVEPVLERLREDPGVAGHLETVATLTRGLPADSLTIPNGCRAAPAQE